MEVNPLFETKVTALTSIKLFIHTVEGSVTILCSLDMPIMWHSYYGRERYAYGVTLFIIHTLKITDDFDFVCNRADHC